MRPSASDVKAPVAPPPRRGASPWIYVPTLYFAEGIPYVIVNTMSVALYKTLGIPNRTIGLMSVLSIPWIIKMLWGPLVDTRATKRRWILGCQFALSAGLVAAAMALQSPLFLMLSLAAFGLIAFASATHDIAVDGFYMLSLSREDQALFAGVRGTFYRVAMIVGSGGLVVLAGVIGRRTGNYAGGWTAVLCLSGALFLGLALFHSRILPRPPADGLRVPGSGGARESFLPVFRSYFTQPCILRIVAFILLYRLAEAMLVKMAQPFLLDPPEKGGLGITVETVGLLYGTVGTCSLLAGGILGGWLISRHGFRNCIWPMALALNIPHLAYAYMAWARPPMGAVYGLVAVEQFGYGVGFSAFTVFLMYIAKPPFQTSHYAISTGLMALGLMLPGMASGYIQEWLGYLAFFVFVCAISLPSLLVALLVRGIADDKK
jgi:MFS transporter, PAT family, beta-lactamase induction signal transducer AmpG